jgi:hypothetical protein
MSEATKGDTPPTCRVVRAGAELCTHRLRRNPRGVAERLFGIHLQTRAASETFACRVKDIATTCGVPAALTKRSLLLRRKGRELNLALTPFEHSPSR